MYTLKHIIWYIHDSIDFDLHMVFILVIIWCHGPSNFNIPCLIQVYWEITNVVSKSCRFHTLLLNYVVMSQSYVVVYCDNINAFYLSDNSVQHPRTKHIELKWILREKVAHDQIRVLHIRSRFHITDIFTKGLSLQLFDDFQNIHNICSPHFRLRRCITFVRRFI